MTGTWTEGFLDCLEDESENSEEPESNIHDIENEMAFSCECGSVKFNLLKSGVIECDGCQQKQIRINWSEENAD